MVSQSAGEHEGFSVQRRTTFEVRSGVTGRKSGHRWVEIAEAGLDALAASTGLPNLVYLDFRHNKASDPTPQVITERNTRHGASYPT
ncbi:MAG: hypothetical protein ACE10K_01385, partial [Rhodothermales bacterium]